MAARRKLLLLSVLLSACPSSLVAQDAVRTPAGQRDQQKRANAAVEQTSRFVNTSLRTIIYQKLEPNEEQRLLDEVAAGLQQLSQEDMKAVLDHLEKAIAATDTTTADAEQKLAQQKHKAIVSSLRSMLFKLDVLRSLEEAAKRMQDQAQREFVLHQRALELHERPTSPNSGYRQSRDALTLAALLKESIEQQSDAQTDLKLEFSNLLKQLVALKPKLDREQSDRLDKADIFGRGGQLLVQMDQAFQQLTSRNYQGASEIDLRISRELQALSIALLTPKDRLTALKELRDKLEQTRKAQAKLTQESAAAKETTRTDDKTRRSFTSERQKEEQDRVAAQKLAEQQGQIEYDTREIRKEIESVDKQLVSRLPAAENEMRTAQEELRRRNAEASIKPQKNAEDHLKKVVEDLDKAIAAAEEAKADPLTATKKAIEDIDKLLGEQKAAKEQTKRNEDKPEALKPTTEKQKDIAKKADALTDLPVLNDKAKEALTDAKDKADDAGDELEKKDAKAAQPKQDEVVKKLEDAKKALQDQAKEMQKRKEDIAKLEAAKEALEKLAAEENKVADAAKKANEDKAETQDLAKKQDELAAPTKDVQDKLKDAAPDAAKKVEEARKDQAEAKKDLAKNDAAEGEKDAKDAAKKLNEAKDEVAKKLNEMKAKEATDQAKLQPNKVDPAEAATQLAKALDEANKAADAAKEAADKADSSPMKDASKSAAAKLADAQKELAKKADKATNPEAAKKAEAAAKSLEEGNLPAAKAEQKAALDALKQPGESQAELAKEQQKLMEAVDALQKSAEANAAAQASLAQAQAAAPKAVKPQLDAAAKQLDKAANELAQGKPGEAGKAQENAAEKLSDALGTLNEAAKAMGDQPAKPGDSQMAKADPGQPGDKPVQKPGDKPGQKPSQQPGQPNQPPTVPADGNGDRKELGSAADAKPSGNAMTGLGNFINLQKLERDKVQQSADAAFPAEFRELIKQYNINIKKIAKPQPAAPATTPPAPTPPAPSK